MSTAIQEPRPLADPSRLFGDYVRLAGAGQAGGASTGDPSLRHRRIGVVNGSSWITPWSLWFGRRYLPGAELLNVSSELLHTNELETHVARRKCPPQANIDALTRYARDLIEIGRADAVVLTCGTMNRAYRHVQQALADSPVPIVHIEQPMIKRAIGFGGRVLVVGTRIHNVNSTQSLLREASHQAGGSLSFGGITAEDAWRHLAQGDIPEHNRAVAQAIRSATRHAAYACIVLAQFSMSAIVFSYPDPAEEFGIPVLTSAQCGFEHVRELLTTLKPGSDSVQNGRGHTT